MVLEILKWPPGVDFSTRVALWVLLGQVAQFPGANDVLFTLLVRSRPRIWAIASLRTSLRARVAAILVATFVFPRPTRTVATQPSVETPETTRRLPPILETLCSPSLPTRYPRPTRDLALLGKVGAATLDETTTVLGFTLWPVETVLLRRVLSSTVFPVFPRPGTFAAPTRDS